MITRLALISTAVVGLLYGQTAVYPSNVVTDAQLKVALNNSQGLLSANISSSATIFSVSSCSPFVSNQLVTIDSEVMSVTSCTGTTMVVGSRPFPDSGNTATSHLAGVPINGYFDAWHHNALRVEIEAIENSLGANLANVLSSTAIVSPTYGGTGINNGAKTVTLGGNLITSGSYNLTLVVPSSNSWTLPAAGTLIGSNDTATVTHTMLVGTDIATVGTITTGTWNGSIVSPVYGGTGHNNGSATITLGGQLTTSGAYNLTIVVPATGSYTLPTAGTLIGSADSGTVTNTMLAGSIAASKLVGTDIATVGTITSGTWHGTVLGPTYGGTGVNNGSSTLTLGGNVVFSGAYNPTIVVPATGSWTLPAAGTLVGSADTGTVTNTMLAGSIANSKLVAPVTVTSCGTSASCASPTSVTTYKVATGSPSFSSSTTLAITGISPAFASTTSYSCSVIDPSHPAYTFGVATVSGSAFTITASSSNSDQIIFSCSGN